MKYLKDLLKKLLNSKLFNATAAIKAQDQDQQSRFDKQSEPVLPEMELGEFPLSIDSVRYAEKSNHGIVESASMVGNITKEKLVAGFEIIKRYGSDGYNKSVDWLVEGLIPSCSNGIVVGRTGVGKTFVLLHLLCCVATGKKFAGRDTEQGLVIIVAAEGGHGISRRIRAWEIQNSMDVGSRLIVIPQAINVSKIVQKEALIADIKDEVSRQGLPLKLLVIDTFSQCSGGMNENDAGSVSQYLQSCNDISEKLDATVINVHHTKRSSNDFRGSETFMANVDFFFDLRPNKFKSKSAKFKVLKQKDGNTDFICDFHLSPVELDVDDKSGKPVFTLCVSSSEELENEESDQQCVETTTAKSLHASWLHSYLEECIDKTDSTLNIQEQMRDYFQFGLEVSMAMPFKRAKDTLSKHHNLKSFRNGNEFMLKLNEGSLDSIPF